MGACFSRCGNGAKKEASSRERENHAAASGCRDPPPAPDSPLEETVKEVLSETPKPRASKTREEPQEKEASVVVTGCDERSEEASEAYSASEGFSASTTTVAETKAGGEVEEEVELVETRRRAERSPATPQRTRSVSAKRDRAVGVGCRSGRSSPSPAKRADGAVGRTNSAREAGRGTGSRAPSGYGIRREPGERSGRRSASPAAKRAADQRLGGQCRGLSSTKENGRASPRRVPPPPPPPPQADSDGERAAHGDSAEGKESLENPLVSLECFIFL